MYVCVSVYTMQVNVDECMSGGGKGLVTHVPAPQSGSSCSGITVYLFVSVCHHKSGLTSAVLSTLN